MNQGHSRRDLLKKGALAGAGTLAGLALMGSLDRSVLAAPSPTPTTVVNRWGGIQAPSVIVFLDSSGNYYVKDCGIGDNPGAMIVNANVITPYGASLGAGTSGVSTTTGGIQEAVAAGATTIVLKANATPYQILGANNYVTVDTPVTFSGYGAIINLGAAAGYRGGYGGSYTAFFINPVTDISAKDIIFEGIAFTSTDGNGSANQPTMIMDSGAHPISVKIRECSVTNSENCFVVLNCNGYYVEKCRFNNTANNLALVISTYEKKDVHFTDNISLANTDTGVFLADGNPIHDVWIEDNYQEGGYVLADLNTGSMIHDIHICRNKHLPNAATTECHPINIITAANTAVVYDIFVEENVLDGTNHPATPSSVGIVVNPANAGVLTGVYVRRNKVLNFHQAGDYAILMQNQIAGAYWECLDNDVSVNNTNPIFPRQGYLYDGNAGTLLIKDNHGYNPCPVQSDVLQGSGIALRLRPHDSVYEIDDPTGLTGLTLDGSVISTVLHSTIPVAANHVLIPTYTGTPVFIVMPI